MPGWSSSWAAGAGGSLGALARLFLTHWLPAPGGAGPSSSVPRGADGICPSRPAPLRPRGPCLLAQHQPTPPVAFLKSQNRLGRKFSALVQLGARQCRSLAGGPASTRQLRVELTGSPSPVLVLLALPRHEGSRAALQVLIPAIGALGHGPGCSLGRQQGPGEGGCHSPSPARGCSAPSPGPAAAAHASKGDTWTLYKNHKRFCTRTWGRGGERLPSPARGQHHTPLPPRDTIHIFNVLKTNQAQTHSTCRGVTGWHCTRGSGSRSGTSQ